MSTNGGDNNWKLKSEILQIFSFRFCRFEILAIASSNLQTGSIPAWGYTYFRYDLGVRPKWGGMSTDRGKWNACGKFKVCYWLV